MLLMENKNMRKLKRRRMNESAFNGALNEVRYDIEHEFKPMDLPGNWFIGLDDVKYDYDELSATLLVLDDKDKVVDEETITIPVDAMKDYTTAEIARLKDRMLKEINEVAENLKDSWNVGRGYYESKVKRSRKVNESFVNPSDDILDAWEMFCNYFKKDRDYVIVREGKVQGDPIVIASMLGEFILTAVGNYDDITIHLATMDDYPSSYKISTKEEMKEWLRKVWLVDV
jgi:hypothetical protein